jgi:hypothetical protein
MLGSLVPRQRGGLKFASGRSPQPADRACCRERDIHARRRLTSVVGGRRLGKRAQAGREIGPQARPVDELARLDRRIVSAIRALDGRREVAGIGNSIAQLQTGRHLPIGVRPHRHCVKLVLASDHSPRSVATQIASSRLWTRSLAVRRMTRRGCFQACPAEPLIPRGIERAD